MVSYELIQYLCCDRKHRKVYIPGSSDSESREMNEAEARCKLDCLGCIFKCRPVIRFDVLRNGL